MSVTPNLELPLIAAGQAQKHITVNEGLAELDAVIQLGVEGAEQNDPPAEPGAGQRWIVGLAPTGAFAGKVDQVAYFLDGGWRFIAPSAGWLAWNAQAQQLLLYDGQGWGAAIVAPQQVDLLGVNTSADAVNRLAVSAPAVLFSHDGDDCRVKVNKSDVDDVASLMFQTGWSGRVECKLAPQDQFEIRTSPDGSNWSTALSIDPSAPAIAGNRFTSGRIFIPNDGVALLTPPATGGMIALLMNDPDYPQAAHSGLLVYDVGPTPALLTLAAGPKLNNLNLTTLTGSAGPDGECSVAVMQGAIQIENRFGDYNVEYVCFC